MPTAAKLVSAVLFAALAWWVGDTIARTVLEEGVQVGRFREMLAAGGALIGWRYLGREVTGRTGRGTTTARAVTAGISGAALLLVFGVLIHSFWVMIVRSLDGAYTEVGRAASAWMDFIWGDLVTVAHPLVLGTLFGGGAVVGLVGGFVGRRFP